MYSMSRIEEAFPIEYTKWPPVGTVCAWRCGREFFKGLVTGLPEKAGDLWRVPFRLTDLQDVNLDEWTGDDGLNTYVYASVEGPSDEFSFRLREAI